LVVLSWTLGRGGLLDLLHLFILICQLLRYFGLCMMQFALIGKVSHSSVSFTFSMALLPSAVKRLSPVSNFVWYALLVERGLVPIEGPRGIGLPERVM
jgi:hypothetical protein